jgi:hypothetical protein
MMTVNETHQLFAELQKEIGRISQQVYALSGRDPEGKKRTPEEIAGQLQQVRSTIHHLLRAYDHMVGIAMGVETKPDALRLNKLKK